MAQTSVDITSCAMGCPASSTWISCRASHLQDAVSEGVIAHLGLGHTLTSLLPVEIFVGWCAVAAALAAAGSGQLRSRGSPGMSPAQSGTLPMHASGANAMAAALLSGGPSVQSM